MTLLTKKITNELPPLHSQENTKDPLALVRFYDTIGDWSWYAIEFDGSNMFFGLVLGFERELGYFAREELEQVNREAGFERITMDSTFQPTKISGIQR